MIGLVSLEKVIAAYSDLMTRPSVQVPHKWSLALNPTSPMAREDNHIYFLYKIKNFI